MKKKIVAIVLSCLLFLTGIPGALALGNTEQQGTDVFFYEGAKALATGDLTLAEEADPEVPVIRSVADYYKAAGKSSRLRSASSAIASKVDNSQSRFFPEIGNQGQMGSCTSWAQTYYQFTYTMNRSMNRTTTPGNCFSPKWAYNLCNGGIDEGSSEGAIYNVLKNQGAATMQQVPVDNDYLSWSPNSELWESTLDYRLKDYQGISAGQGDTPITGPKDEDLDVLKTALQNGDVLTFSTYIYSWSYGTISENQKAPGNSSHKGERIAFGMHSEEGGHRMTIVGYDDDIWYDINKNNIVEPQEMGAFKIANSWGTGYMDNGFCWVSYDALNKVSSVANVDETVRINIPIMRSITRINVEPYRSNSEIVLKYTLNAKLRRATPVTILAEKDGAIVESAKVTPYAESALMLSYDQYSYDGTQNANDGSMCCDLSKVFRDIDSELFEEYDWFVKFEDTIEDGNVLTVKDVKIVDKNTDTVYTAKEQLPFTLDGQKKRLSFYKADRNTAVIYYRGYRTPYICYKTGEGEWTQQPGVPMESNSEQKGYTHKYVIELGGADETASFCFTDGNGNWDTNGGSYYTAGKGFHKFVTENAGIEPLAVTGIDTSAANNEGAVGRSMTLYAQAEGGYAPYEYQFSLLNFDGTVEWTSEYKGWSGHVFTPYKKGTCKVVVHVKDISGAVATKTLDIDIKGIEISSLTILPDAAQAGTEMEFMAQTINEFRSSEPNPHTLTIEKEGAMAAQIEMEITDQSYPYVNFAAKWTPQEPGDYTAKLYVKDIYGQTDEKVVSFAVTQPAANELTVYYKGYACPNIHYQIGAGAWTDVPGVKMTPTNEVNGYTHKYTIDLGDAEYANVCFNDGSGSWDNNNGQNYRFEAGTYGCSGGVTVPLDLSKPRVAQFTVSAQDEELTVGKSISLTAAAEGGEAPYEYQFGLQGTDGTVKWTTQYSGENSYSFTAYTGGSFKAFVNIKDANGAVCTKAISLEIKGLEITSFAAAPKTGTVGTEMVLTARTLNELFGYGANVHGIAIKKGDKPVASIGGMNYTQDGRYTDFTAKWTPQEAGDYTARLYIKDAYGQTAEKTIAFTVMEKASNTLTIYYKGYTNPNIHYQVGDGAWTAVPGIAMTPTGTIVGYTHIYTIDLGAATYANVCFNDGNGNWDSNNGQNYRFEAGIYTYKDGTLVKHS